MKHNTNKYKATPVSNQGMRVIISKAAGFTLIELMVSIAVAGILLGGMVMGITQVIITNAKSIAHTVAVKEVENAALWLTRDCQMAQHINGVALNATSNLSTRPFPLTISWNNSLENTSGNVTYNISADGRSLLRSSSNNGGPAQNTVIVAHIGNSTWNLTKAVFSDGYISYTLTFNITSNISGFRQATETRLFRVYPRTN